MKIQVERLLKISTTFLFLISTDKDKIVNILIYGMDVGWRSNQTQQFVLCPLTNISKESTALSKWGYLVKTKGRRQ